MTKPHIAISTTTALAWSVGAPATSEVVSCTITLQGVPMSLVDEVASVLSRHIGAVNADAEDALVGRESAKAAPAAEQAGARILGPDDMPDALGEGFAAVSRFLVAQARREQEQERKREQEWEVLAAMTQTPEQTEEVLARIFGK